MLEKRITQLPNIVKRHYEMGVTSADEMTAERIKAIRARENLSQSQFASKLQISTTCLQKWERGAAQPKGLAYLALKNIEATSLSSFLDF